MRIKFIVLAIFLTALPALALVEPPIPPQEPPQPPKDTQFLAAPAPLAAPSAETDPFARPKGIFGRGQNAELSGGAFFSNGLFLNAGLALIFSDPWHLGENLGLAEDALVYKAGLAFAPNLQVVAETTLYLKEGSLYGFDPFVGAALTSGSVWRIFGGAVIGENELAIGLAVYERIYFSLRKGIIL